VVCGMIWAMKVNSVSVVAALDSPPRVGAQAAYYYLSYEDLGRTPTFDCGRCPERSKGQMPLSQIGGCSPGGIPPFR
jgi:hypothetical protein